jgi:hypothetical protein
LITYKTAPCVKALCLRIDKGSDRFRSFLARKRFSKRQHYFAVTSTLHILTNGNSSKDSEIARNVDADRADRLAMVNQHHRIVAVARLVWMMVILG